MKIALALTLLLVLLQGCFPFEQSRIKEEPFVLDKVHKYSAPIQTPPRAGSIWQPQYAGDTFFSDYRAKVLGDIITVKIVEVSQASEKATTDTDRKSDLDYGIPNFFGQETRYPLNHVISPANLIKANTKNTFAGSGETTRSGTITATIAAKVVEVLPNGNIAIEGKREIYVNHEKKEILLQGVVRPRDVGKDNTILSTQVADAKMIITGIGVIGEKQRPGWLARVLDGVWPF
jgi:flagellar L-ring protein FlgH